MRRKCWQWQPGTSSLYLYFSPSNCSLTRVITSNHIVHELFMVPSHSNRKQIGEHLSFWSGWASYHTANLLDVMLLSWASNRAIFSWSIAAKRVRHLTSVVKRTRSRTAEGVLVDRRTAAAHTKKARFQTYSISCILSLTRSRNTAGSILSSQLVHG